MMKNDVYFIVLALLVAELFKILIYANLRTSQCGHSDVKSQNIKYL